MMFTHCLYVLQLCLQLAQVPCLTKGEEGVLSWSDLVRLGNSTSDTNLSARLANIAINQVSKINPKYFAMRTLAHVHISAE